MTFNYKKAINLGMPSFTLEKHTLQNYNSGKKLPNKQKTKHIVLYHLKNSAVRMSSTVLQCTFLI